MNKIRVLQFFLTKDKGFELIQNEIYADQNNKFFYSCIKNGSLINFLNRPKLNIPDLKIDQKIISYYSSKVDLTEKEIENIKEECLSVFKEYIEQKLLYLKTELQNFEYINQLLL